MRRNNSNIKVALVYDRVNKWGGAERILLALHKLFPSAPLYTSVYSQKKAPWAESFTVKHSFLQKVPFASGNHEFFPMIMPLAFEHFNFDYYDLVISITSEAAKGIITKPKTKHICYCLTPTRYLWSGYDEYFQNPALRFISKPAISYLRTWDKYASKRPDIFIAISNEVSGRIKKYYDRDSSVIYPPVGLSAGRSASSGIVRKNLEFKLKDYYLVVSRLSNFTSYKRVDLAIDACLALNLPLVIVGTGNLETPFRRRAGNNTYFFGNVSDEELIYLYQNSKALIFPGLEDFGIVPVESQRFGKPVIAYNKGGIKETVVHGQTGYLFPQQSVDSLVNALKEFSSLSFSQEKIKKQAEKFTEEIFSNNFLMLVNKII